MNIIHPGTGAAIDLSTWRVISGPFPCEKSLHGDLLGKNPVEFVLKATDSEESLVIRGIMQSARCKFDSGNLVASVTLSVSSLNGHLVSDPEMLIDLTYWPITYEGYVQATP